MFIYKVRNRVNGKIYISKCRRNHWRQRWAVHVAHAVAGGKTYFHKAIRKYGVEAFEIIELARAKSPEALIALEKAYIEQFQSYIPKVGYNSMLGGEGLIYAPNCYVKEAEGAGGT
jgi:hypothetical protein